MGISVQPQSRAPCLIVECLGVYSIFLPFQLFTIFELICFRRFLCFILALILSSVLIGKTLPPPFFDFSMSSGTHKFYFCYAVKFPDLVPCCKGSARVFIVERTMPIVPKYIYGRVKGKRDSEGMEYSFLQKETAVMIF